MSPAEAKKQIEKLRATVAHHAELYYRQALKPDMFRFYGSGTPFYDFRPEGYWPKWS